MFASPKLAKRRRLNRRLKAAASVLVALAAGSFIACQRQLEKWSGEAASPSVGSAGEAGGAPKDVGHDRGEAGSIDSSAAASAKVADARSPRATDAAIDVKEHRKGMPVPDNLLE